ncbi:hypothetical protein XI04_04635 [Bradyrhizobium sp. CCBAU 11430]|uniref:hypothetical protein n=1 Tax=unclassified Bradyrhizobium TaxID=2631580 RepID=UPI002306863E|nr:MULTISPECIES: hypothetical protein [unclassified Bradyrhizobium]MDA9419166.1 hypothetical protein [Bradyrhizobium sp. CCBAU 25360]MDA9512350.1 hypothetical protein [Bradyrhizobium sp. CCBAU 11430]
MDPFEDVNRSEARMDHLEPQQEETAQADFEQRLRESQPILAALASPGAGSSRTVTDGNKRAQAILENERCTAASFVGTRAQLAATLTCANIAELRREIEIAAQRSAKWSRASGSLVDRVDSGRVYDDVVGSSYVELERFQNHASHCKPHALDRQSAMAHLRSMAALRYEAAPWNIWGGQRLDLGRTAAEHMRGGTSSSPFVSLSEEASQLLLSPDDDNEYGAKAIAENANELHTYTVPRVTTWTAEDIVSILEDGTENDEPALAWVSDTPTEEREVLFLGGNLDDYRTASASNPYKTSGTND